MPSVQWGEGPQINGQGGLTPDSVEKGKVRAVAVKMRVESPVCVTGDLTSEKLFSKTYVDEKNGTEHTIKDLMGDGAGVFLSSDTDMHKIKDPCNQLLQKIKRLSNSNKVWDKQDIELTKDLINFVKEQRPDLMTEAVRDLMDYMIDGYIKDAIVVKGRGDSIEDYKELFMYFKTHHIDHCQDPEGIISNIEIERFRQF